MSSLTSRYAAAASTLALLVSLGGTSYAAVKIGTAQLKDGAVTSAKIRNGAVTGADVAEGSLGPVPRAARADTVGGNAITKVSFRAAEATAPTVLFDSRGLVITVTCTPVELRLRATTTKAGSYVSTTVIRDSDPGNPAQDDREGSDFDPGEEFDVLAGDDGDTNHIELAYAAADGAVVTATLDTDRGTPVCLVVGFVTSG